MLELTYNWDPEPYPKPGRAFGHLAYRVDDIYETCARLRDGGVTVLRPPRDGHMAFVRSPDGISIELLQAGESLAHKSMAKHGEHRRLVELPKFAGNGATFSACRNYRYLLWRRWSAEPVLVFICLNPSTADEQHNDPTNRRTIGFAKDLATAAW